MQKAFLFSQNNELLFVENVSILSKTLMANGADNNSSPLFYLRHFSRGLSKTIPRSLFLNRTETVTTQGNRGGEFAIYEFIIFNSSTFLKEKSITFKIDVVSQDILFNQNVIAF